MAVPAIAVAFADGALLVRQDRSIGVLVDLMRDRLLGHPFVLVLAAGIMPLVQTCVRPPVKRDAQNVSQLVVGIAPSPVMSGVEGHEDCVQVINGQM